ncbi:MAG: MaoC family dehydratase N-terminal domain-containing protein [Novosphingobium sp.]|nr:MaoC family dehydratase N-terminal domain-containing protein [Novosphingobium sp.]
MKAWIGRSELRTDRIDPGHAARWLATLDRAAPADGTMPQGFHWCLCLPDAPSSSLGADGHPQRDDGPASLLPPLPHLPRRMWASSKLEFLGPLRLGAAIERRSTVQSIEAKQGSSGELVFVTLRHETTADGQPVIHERQSLVYRAAAASDAPLNPPPGAGQFNPAEWHAHRTIVPNEALLFRYSALTFNSHRIHYDLPYARDVERYRGLVVHGPLTATLLLDLARRELGDNALKSFAFRGLSPAIGGEALHLAMRLSDDGWEFGAFAEDGRPIASGSGA